MAGVSRLVYLVAGEPSADALGAHLIQALARDAARRNGQLHLAGVGGPAMVHASARAGAPLCPLFPASELTVMGLVELMRSAPNTWRRAREVAADVQRVQPDALVFIDGKGFARRVAARLRRRNLQAGRHFPVIQYVAPSIWAWKGSERSVAATKALFDHIFVLFPFEMEAWAHTGMPVSLVGSPAVEDWIVAEKAHTRFDNASSEALTSNPSVAVLLGSRPQEVQHLGPIVGQALESLSRTVSIRCRLPAVPEVAPLIHDQVARWNMGGKVIDVQSDMSVSDWTSSDVGCIASGTAVLQAALSGLPATAVYTCNRATAWVARRRAKVRFVSIPNIIAGREVIPEHLFENCRPDAIYRSLHTLLEDKHARQGQLDQLVPVREHLVHHCHGQLPSDRAVAALNQIWDGH